MTLEFSDFSLLHQFIPKYDTPADTPNLKRMKGSSLFASPAELLSGWPPEDKVDLALSNVAGLSMARFRELGAQGLPDPLNLGDPCLKITPALRELVAARHGRPGEPERVLLTSGASEANFLIMASLLTNSSKRDPRPGKIPCPGFPFSRVIIEDPTYPPLLNLPLGFGAKVLKWPRDPVTGSQARIDDLKQLLEASDRSALVVMTNLHNPSGTPTPPSQMRALAETVGDNGGLMVVDEIFRELHPGLESVALLGDHCLAVGSVSKVYGVSNLRVGWIVGEPSLIQRLRELKEYVTAVNSAPCELLTYQALSIGDRLVHRARAIKEANMPRVEAFCNDRPELTWYPSAGLIAFIGVDHPLGSLGLAERLRDDFGILISAGDHFGWSGYLRIGYGCPPEDLEGRLAALGNALDNLSGGERTGPAGVNEQKPPPKP